MKMKFKIDSRITKALKRFEKAVYEKAFIVGIWEPEDYEGIKKEYREAKRALLDLLTPTVNETPRAVQDML